jgi:hypothetical protein
MALSSTTVQPTVPVSEKTENHATSASVLSMIVLSVYAAQKSNKNFRRLKRRFLWTAMKLKARSFFTGSKSISDKTLLYILLGVLALILVLLAPIVALVLVIAVLILILMGVI